MKKFLALLVKSLLVITVIALAALLVFGLVLMLDWPWWTSSFFVLFFLGVAIGVIWLRKMLLRRKEEQFVNQIVSQEEMQLKGVAEQEKERLRNLQTGWTEAIEKLKKSHLRKFGNPLYVLPWYLVIGESGSGKTTAIKSANLSSPFAEGTHVSGLSGTRNCDWWFFDQAIILDTAGRYAIPVDESSDKDEWRNFLSLLSKYRKKEPLNGLLVCVAADKLLEGTKEQLESEGLQIRNRIDELMLSIGSKFPVYVVVTKCDLVKGMTQFSDSLPESVVEQAMGMVTPKVDTPPQFFWKKAVETVSERVSTLLLRILHDSGVRKLDPALVLFPCEFERLSVGLEPFMAKAFQENPYQETPILRGMFFTSGRQEGTPYSHFLHKIGLLGVDEVLEGTNKGLFLHDFFAKILPLDRGIFAPTRRALEWSRLSRNLGLISWVALVVAFCVLMSFSFVKNLSTMREIPNDFLETSIVRGDLLLDVVGLEQYQQAILVVEEKNKSWWIPRFGLHESLDLEQELKDDFSIQFHKSFLGRLDATTFGRMAKFSPATPNRVIGFHIGHLVRRINLLTHRLNSLERQELFGKPQASFLVAVSEEEGSLIPEIRQKMATLYVHYLLWSKDENQIAIERKNLQAWLKQLLALKENRLDWLIDWANVQSDLAPVTLEDFWGRNLSKIDDLFVAPAFTQKGKEQIDDFIVELGTALPEPGTLLISAQKKDFEALYLNRFVADWRKFAENFPQGANYLKGHEQWLPVAQEMANLSGPYVRLIERMQDELTAVIGGAGENGSIVDVLENQEWVSLVLQYQEIKEQANLLAKAEGGTLLAKAGMRSRNLIGRIGSRLDSSAAEARLDNQLKAAKAYLNYHGALNESAQVLVPRKAAYVAAAAVYNDENTLFSSASQAVSTMKSYLSSGKSDEEPFWALLHGPIDFLWTYVRNETGCYLQERWEKDVYVEIQGVEDKQKVLQLLLDQDGYATQFVQGPAAPFLSRNPKKGYYAESALDGKISFDPGLLDFLTRGATVKRSRRPNYDVTVKGLPTEVNQTALIKPHATHLELQCGEKSQKISNFQFPVRKQFKWSQETCSDVVFEIEVGDLILTKVYEGNRAFPEFLADFKGGKKKFYPGHFPGQQRELKNLGIKYIAVNYRFSGQGAVLGISRATPKAVPERITKCWD